MCDKKRAPRGIVFDSITELSKALLGAKDAHSEFERSLGAKDDNWPLWYAAYIAREQGLMGRWRSACRARMEIPSAMGETVQKHLGQAKSVWHEPRRRTMICRMLRYLVVTATVFYHSRNFASTSIRTLLGVLLNGKNSHSEGKWFRAVTKPGTARTRRTELGFVERSDQGRGITPGHSGGNAPGFTQPGPL